MIFLEGNLSPISRLDITYNYGIENISIFIDRHVWKLYLDKGMFEEAEEYARVRNFKCSSKILKFKLL